METMWEQTPEGISVGYEERIVRIRSDETLKDYLDQPGNGAAALAAYISRRYAALLGAPLAISEASLAVEILLHVYAGVLAEKEEQLAAQLPAPIREHLMALGEKILYHTAVIDSGEESVDSNRWVFDLLAPYRNALYRILGDRA